MGLFVIFRIIVQFRRAVRLKWTNFRNKIDFRILKKVLNSALNYEVYVDIYLVKCKKGQFRMQNKKGSKNTFFF